MRAVIIAAVNRLFVLLACHQLAVVARFCLRIGTLARFLIVADQFSKTPDKRGGLQRVFIQCSIDTHAFHYMKGDMIKHLHRKDVQGKTLHHNA